MSFVLFSIDEDGLMDLNSPDKNPGVKGIHERFARLSVIAEILKGKESRERCVPLRKN